MDSSGAATASLAITYYTTHMCSHADFKIERAHELAESFRKVPKNLKVDTIWCMFLSLTSPPDTSNNLMSTNKSNTTERKKDAEVMDQYQDATQAMQ